MASSRRSRRTFGDKASGYRNQPTSNVRLGATAHRIRPYSDPVGLALRTGYSADYSREDERIAGISRPLPGDFTGEPAGSRTRDSSLSQEPRDPAPSLQEAPRGLSVRSCSNDCGTPAPK